MLIDEHILNMLLQAYSLITKKITRSLYMILEGKSETLVSQQIFVIFIWICYLYFIWIWIFGFKKCRKRSHHYGAGSMPMGMPISCLNTRFPMVKHLVIENEIASIKICPVKHFLSQPFYVQQIDNFGKAMELRVFDLKIKF